MAIEGTILRLLDSWVFLTPSMLELMADRSRPLIYRAIERLLADGYVRDLGHAEGWHGANTRRICGHYYAITQAGIHARSGCYPAGFSPVPLKLLPPSGDAIPNMLTVNGGSFPAYQAYVCLASAAIHQILYHSRLGSEHANYLEKGFFLDSKTDLRRAGWYSWRSRPLKGINAQWLVPVPDFRVRAGNRNAFVEVQLSPQARKYYTVYRRLLPPRQQVIWLCIDAVTASLVRERLPTDQFFSVAMMDKRSILGAVSQALEIKLTSGRADH